MVAFRSAKVRPRHILSPESPPKARARNTSTKRKRVNSREKNHSLARRARIGTHFRGAKGDQPTDHSSSRQHRSRKRPRPEADTSPAGVVRPRCHAGGKRAMVAFRSAKVRPRHIVSPESPPKRRARNTSTKRKRVNSREKNHSLALRASMSDGRLSLRESASAAHPLSQIAAKNTSTKYQHEAQASGLSREKSLACASC